MRERILYLSTPAFGVPTLKLLAEDPRFEVVGVVTQPDKPAGRGLKPTPSPVKLAALELDLPVFQPKRLLDPEAQAEILTLNPTVGAVAAYGQWIPAAVFDLPPKRSLNLHPSLLPRHRGAAPVLSALLAGDDQVGLTALFVEDEMDSGDIIAQMSIPVGEDDTTGSLMARLAEVGAPFFVEALAGWADGKIVPQAQDHSQSTWISRLGKESGCIDWSQPAVEIARCCRAYEPWPGAYTFLNGKRLFIRRAKAMQGHDQSSCEPGTVVETDTGLAVVTGEGLLKLEQVQLEGRRRMDAQEFACGQRCFIGEKLGKVIQG